MNRSNARGGTRMHEVAETRGGTRAGWAIVAGLSLVSLLVLLDDTAVSVALPTIQRQVGFGFGALEWVINAYTLTIAGLTLLAGHLADRQGAVRIFLAGLGIFVLGSLLSGVAFNVVFLIASRAVQGTGVALVAPASLSLIATTFSDHRRGTALGVWAGVSASALGIGPVVGAYITETLGWNWIFLLNVPLGAAAWLLALRILPRFAPTHPAHRLDVLGAALSGLGLLGLLLALNQGSVSGWASPVVIILFGGSALAFGLFFLHERRTPVALVDLSLFKNRFFSAANIVTLLSTAVMCSLFFFLALYLQTVVGLSALASGATLLPLTLTIVVIAPLSGRLVERVGARPLIVTGMVILAAGLFGMSRQGLGSNVLTLMLWLAVTGLGIAIARTPTTTTALGNAGDKAFGMAAGVFNTFQATGLALGIALMGIILTSFGPQAAFSRELSAAHHAAFVTGFSIALNVNGAIALFAALLAAYMMRPRRPPLRRVARR
jgi:EmrB/QacA subfamily drug resistance transporter